MSRNKNKNYYDVLGVSKTSSNEEIKKAYRDLAMQHHPDKGGDQEKMKEINEAYSILSDPQKRAEFDNPPQQHFNPFTRGNPFAGSNPFESGFSGDINLDEILNNINGFRFSFGGGQGFTTSTQMINHTVKLDLIKALEGGDVEFDIPQIGKRIKFELPPDLNHGANYKIRIAGNDKNQVILSMTIEINLPKGLSKDKIGKIKEILSSPEVKAEEPKT